MKKFLILFILFAAHITQPNIDSKYVIGHWSGGMGICLTNVFNHLLLCDQQALIPVIMWKQTYYHNPEGFNGKYNEWEYYFNPVSDLKYNEGDIINYFCTEAACGKFTYYDVSQEKRNRAYALLSKYITLNTIVQTKVDQFYNNFMSGKRTIGIHIRGTDKYTEERPISPEQAIAQALQHADENTQFFIATDEEKLLIQMLELLQGKKVIYYDCYRSKDGIPLHHPQTLATPSPGQLGEDVIVEMWIMSKCDVLVHTLSNVSSIPLYINPNLQHITLR